MKAKLVNEYFVKVGDRGAKRVYLDEITFEDIKSIKPVPTSEWAPKPKASIPGVIGDSQISNERQFNSWYDEFIHMFGTEGYIEEVAEDKWKVKGNTKYNRYKGLKDDEMSGAEEDRRKKGSRFIGMG